MAQFSFENKKIYYTQEGEGVPLLFLHGNTASSRMFKTMVSKYQKYYQVILIDFLGHGKSERLDTFPIDLWFYEAQQVIKFLEEKNLEKVNIIGSSGGALVAINIALEAPHLVNSIIADSFEGESALKEFTENVIEDRERSKQNQNTRLFYEEMQGNDWEQVIDNDTEAIYQHAKKIGIFFHKQLKTLKPAILLTGSKEDEFVSSLNTNYFENTYENLLNKIGHGEYYLFKNGGHPSMLSNQEEFFQLSLKFFKMK